MLHLFPYLEGRIDSGQTPESLYMVLKAVTGSGGEFIGQIHPLGFRIMPKAHWRNSFLPIATGDIRENEGRVTVAVTFRMHILTRIFLAFWFGLSGFGLLCGIPAAITIGLKGTAFILTPLGFMALGWVFIGCCFYGPARKALKRLEKLLG